MRPRGARATGRLRAELRQRLGDLELLEELPPIHIAALHALVEDARRRQSAALAAARQHALRYVPRLLRKPLLQLFADPA